MAGIEGVGDCIGSLRRRTKAEGPKCDCAICQSWGWAWRGLRDDVNVLTWLLAELSWRASHPSKVEDVESWHGHAKVNNSA